MNAPSMAERAALRQHGRRRASGLRRRTGGGPAARAAVAELLNFSGATAVGIPSLRPWKPHEPHAQPLRRRSRWPSPSPPPARRAIRRRGSAKAGRAPPRPSAARRRPPPPGDAAVRAALLKAVPGATIDSIKPSPIPGYREVAIGGKVVYVQHRRQAT